MASDASVGDEFGSSVAISDDYAIVGADEADLKHGAAYVFKREGDAWIEQQKLTASDGRYEDFFGSSVSISGDYAFVGAPEKSEGAGAVYVFRREGDTWIQHQVLTASDGEGGFLKGDGFGASIAISGKYVIVGAPGDDGSAGAAYVFRSESNGWIEQQKLWASDWNRFDNFGGSVSIDGSYAVVGTPYKDESTGAAYVFRQDGGMWFEQQRLIPSDVHAGHTYGRSVSMSGDRIVVGSDENDFDMNAVAHAGAAYVFERDGNFWIERQKLTAASGHVTEDFGASVSLDGDYMIVADVKHAVKGAAYVFRREGTTWLQWQKLTVTDGDTDGAYGGSVSISGPQAIVGAHRVDEMGAAYVYRLESVSTGISSIDGLPGFIMLGQNFPNPFRSTTTISFNLPKADAVSIRVYDLLGRNVATLVDGRRAAGRHVVTFEPGDLASGGYVYRLTVGGTIISRRMMLLD